MTQETSPQTEDRNGLPAPLRAILKLIMWTGFFAAVFWAAMSFLLNYFLKDSFELYASGMLHTPVRLNGGVRLGNDLLKPSMVMSDIVAGYDRANAILTLDRLEIGMPWQKVDPAKIETLSFFIRVDGLRVEGRDYGDYHLPVKMLPGGDFEVQGMTGRMEEGAFTAGISRKGPIATAEAEATGLDYGQFMQGARGATLRAKMNLTVASAPNVADMVPTLKGSFTIVGGEGAMEDRGLTFWTGDLVKSLFLPSEKETKISCAVADFAVENGVALARTFIIDTEKVTIFGAGKIDFAQSRIDMLMTPRPKSPALLSLATPVRIEGPFTAVTTAPDPAGIAGKIGGVLLGVLAPAMPPAALLPFVRAGAGGAQECAKYLEKQEP